MTPEEQTTWALWEEVIHKDHLREAIDKYRAKHHDATHLDLRRELVEPVLRVQEYYMSPASSTDDKQRASFILKYAIEETNARMSSLRSWGGYFSRTFSKKWDGGAFSKVGGAS